MCVFAILSFPLMLKLGVASVSLVSTMVLGISTYIAAHADDELPRG